MNKYSVITIIAIIVIVTPFVFAAMSIVGSQQLEYRWSGPGRFSFFALSNSGDIEFCNTIPFWTSFQKFEIATFYDSKHLGSFIVNPTTINPLSSSVQSGVFSSEEIAAAQHNFMTLDFEFNGGDIRLDPNKFVIVVQTNNPILGIIPYHTTTQISGFDFNQKMSVDDLTCD